MWTLREFVEDLAGVSLFLLLFWAAWTLSGETRGYDPGTILLEIMQAK